MNANTDATTLETPIKVNWTGVARTRIKDVNLDLESEQSDRVFDALDRQKTNVVIRTVSEAEAIVWEMGSYEGEGGQNGRVWMNGPAAKACGRVKQEVVEAMEERGYTAETTSYGSVSGFVEEDDEPVTVREEETVEGYELPDEPEDDEWDPEPLDLREGETTDDDTHARRNAEQLRVADEDDDLPEATDDDVREAVEDEDSTPCTDGGVSAEDMESVESEEFDLGERLHAKVQPVDSARRPVDLRGTVVDTADEDSPSLTIDTGSNRYKFTASHVHQLPEEEDENSLGQSFEELKGVGYTLFRDPSTTSTDGGTSVPSCSECDYEGDDVELSTVTEEVEEVVSSRYDSRDPRYDPETRTRLEGYEVPLCSTCRGEAEVEEVSA